MFTLYFWMMCFGVIFPASPFFIFVILVLTVFIEMTQMNEYQRRDAPQTVLGVGQWTDIFNYCNHISFVSLSAAQVLASENTVGLIKEEHRISFLLLLFLFEHIFFGFKYLLSIYIPDCPDWVEEC